MNLCYNSNFNIITVNRYALEALHAFDASLVLFILLTHPSTSTFSRCVFVHCSWYLCRVPVPVPDFSKQFLYPGCGLCYLFRLFFPSYRSQWPRTVFLCTNTETVGSNPTQDNDGCVYSVFLLSCVGNGLATGWSAVQGVPPTVYVIRKLKRNGVSRMPLTIQRTQQEIWMNVVTADAVNSKGLFTVKPIRYIEIQVGILTNESSTWNFVEINSKS
jgi:hypothetical protein